MMLDKVKLALRKTAAVFNDEIEDYIASGIADLRLVGINVPENAGSSSETLGDPLLDRAIILYAKSEDMKLHSRRGKRQKKFLANERFATKTIVAIGVTTVIFITAQYVSFLITEIEQTTLIQYYFSAVVIECGALMLKRVSEVIVARIKKKEQIEPETDTDESEVL